MSSHRLKLAMRGALAAGVVVAAAVGVTPATAAPSANTDPVQKFEQLSKQADKLNEQINNAKVALKNKNAQVAKANTAIAAAQRAETAALAKEDQFRGQVDQLTDASFEGARLNQVAALFTGTSARDYLNRATDLQELAEDSTATLDRFAGALNAAKSAEAQATAAKANATAAAASAAALVKQLTTQKAQLQTQITKVNEALHQLSSAQQTALNTDVGPSGSFVAPAGVAGKAMQEALAQRGKPYEFGGSGPSSFDCSGLVDYAYALAGRPGLPHSAAALQGMGVSVSRADLQPGDLVFFGSPAYHVGIYVGNDEMVNAPDSGSVVRVESLFSGYSGARRLGS
ncbi:MAG TPA: C40 family peptidase [Pseudonocardiaceae bacterium]|nr:C40 family peptidase [Pseudonocardiaceae bacterium]